MGGTSSLGEEVSVLTSARDAAAEAVIPGVQVHISAYFVWL